MPDFRKERSPSHARRQQKRWREGPSAITPSQKEAWRFALTDALLDLRGDISQETSSLFIASRAVHCAIEAWFALSSVWPPPPRRTLEVLVHNAPRLSDAVARFYVAPSSEHALKVLEIVLDAHGGELSKYETPRRHIGAKSE